MGLSTIARKKWIAAPVMAAMIGLAAPGVASAATDAPQGPRPVLTSAQAAVDPASTLRQEAGRRGLRL